jgi:hypothetical protein
MIKVPKISYNAGSKGTYQVPKLCVPVSSERNPGKIDSVNAYIRNISSK